ncbi:MAG TPA: hypothetical protein VKI44_12130 [Acetobacteraceae bacterium]|nr:hypothetical protein [Acetobacteraceae bacterium]
MEIILRGSDINMPAMSEFDLLPVVNERRTNLPVFMISAYSDATPLRWEGHGSDEFKPVDFRKRETGYHGSDG